MRRRMILVLATLIVASTVGFATAAAAAGTKHLHFEYGPVHAGERSADERRRHQQLRVRARRSRPGDATPTVQAGQSITFTNDDAPASGYGTWHTITSCRLPCNLSTGVAYPTANADIEFDSGQLGNDGQPTAGRLTWDTPNNLPNGTYAFFCRVHPFMRGSFRVVP
jgi:plastocyanin